MHTPHATFVPFFPRPRRNSRFEMDTDFRSRHHFFILPFRGNSIETSGILKKDIQHLRRSDEGGVAWLTGYFTLMVVCKSGLCLFVGCNLWATITRPSGFVQVSRPRPLPSAAALNFRIFRFTGPARVIGLVIPEEGGQARGRIFSAQAANEICRPPSLSKGETAPGWPVGVNCKEIR